MPRLAAAALQTLLASVACAATPYDIGTPILQEIWVSPAGDDSRDGSAPATALRSLTAAWARVPSGTPLTGTGLRINLLPGVYACEPAEPDDCRNFVADRHGTAQFPIILAGPPPGTGAATLRGGLDLDRMDYFYLMNLTLAGGGDLPLNASGNNLLHLAEVDHVLVRNVRLLGPECDTDACTNLQEVLKVNRSTHLYVEGCEVRGAWHTGIDLFSAQHTQIIGCNIHTVGQWCVYAKGGSAYLLVEGNEFHHAQLGFGAGQSANLAVMRPPWLHYDVYDVKFVNNVVHHLDGVALSVRGTFNGLFAWNTFVDVATDTTNGYPLLEALPAERGCNPTDEVQDPVGECARLIASGAWGPDFLTENVEAIPSRNIGVYNNIFWNRAPARSLYTHMSVRGPQERPAGFRNLPDVLLSDDGLTMAGNVIWNGPADHPIGLDDTTGCGAGHPTCSEAALRSSNAVNAFEPGLVNPDGNDFRPVPGSALAGFPGVPVPDFAWETFTPAVPAGTLSNRVPADRAGNPRPAGGPPGAYVASERPAANGFVIR